MRVCRPCGERSKKRVQRVAGSGVVTGVDGLFLTVTAPSWRQHFHARTGMACRCTGGGHANLAEWNATAGKRFNWLMRDLGRWLGRCRECRRRLIAGRRKVRSCAYCSPDVKLVYFKGAETQTRGALHFHWLVRRADGQPLRLRKAEFKWWALRHGFGHEVDVTAIAEHHAGYVAKYASKSASERPDVPWAGWRRTERVDRETGEIVKGVVWSTRATYRTWSKSRAWGDSMRTVRCRQAHHEHVLEMLPAWGDGRWMVPVYADAVRRRPAEPRAG